MTAKLGRESPTNHFDKLYHAMPLHYLPSLITSGALYAQSVLAATVTSVAVPRGVSPRSTAARRDRMLGVDDYVHLSPTPKSPLLADKLRRGYPHALLIFDAARVFELPEVALLPYNTKAWRTRACFAPVTDPWERASLLRRHSEANRLPSLEILVKYGLSLTPLTAVAFIDDRERQASERAIRESTLWPDLFVTAPDLFPRPFDYAPANWPAIADYFDRCQTLGTAQPPTIPFD